MYSTYTTDRTIDSCKVKGPLIIYTNQQGKDDLEATELMVEEKQRFHIFSVAELKMEFLNPNTRDEELRNMYLLEVDLPSSEVSP